MPPRSTLISQKKEISELKSDDTRPLDEPTFKACQQALDAALVVARQLGYQANSRPKAKLALLIISSATKGEVRPHRAAKANFRKLLPTIGKQDET